MKSEKDWVDPFVEHLCSVEKIENSKTLDRRLSNLVRQIQADTFREAARISRRSVTADNAALDLEQCAKEVES